MKLHGYRSLLMVKRQTKHTVGMCVCCYLLTNSHEPLDKLTIFRFLDIQLQLINFSSQPQLIWLPQPNDLKTQTLLERSQFYSYQTKIWCGSSYE